LRLTDKTEEAMPKITWRVSTQTFQDFRNLMARVSMAEEDNDIEAYWETLEYVKMLPGFPHEMNFLTDEVDVVEDHTLNPVIMVN
jgi:hypothetical protein